MKKIYGLHFVLRESNTPNSEEPILNYKSFTFKQQERYEQLAQKQLFYDEGRCLIIHSLTFDRTFIPREIFRIADERLGMLKQLVAKDYRLLETPETSVGDIDRLMDILDSNGVEDFCRLLGTDAELRTLLNQKS